MNRELLFSVCADDCEWQYYRGSGNGGQKKQKTSSAVRCTHRPSGAVGRAQDTRSQWENKRLAFRRMAESREFRAWANLEAAKITGLEARAWAYAEREVNSNRTVVEVRMDGKWQKEDQGDE